MKRTLGYLLYGLTVVLELAAAWLRWRMSFAFFSFFIKDPTSQQLALVVGYAPLIWSALNVLGVPGGGFATRRALGATVLSQRE